MSIPQVDNDLQSVVPHEIKVPLSYEYLLDFRSLDTNTRLRDVNRHETQYNPADLFTPAYVCENDPKYPALFMGPQQLLETGNFILPRNHLTPHMVLEPTEPKSYEETLLACRNEDIGKSSKMTARKYFAKQNEIIDMIKMHMNNQLQRLRDAYGYINSLGPAESSGLYTRIHGDRMTLWNTLSPDGKYISMMVGFPDILGDEIVLQKYASFMSRYVDHSLFSTIGTLVKH